MERLWGPHGQEEPDHPPSAWWGRFGVRTDEGLSLVDLVRLGSLDAATAAFLWLAMEQRATVIVAAREHGAGKTTLLTALVDLLPPDISRYYLHGWYERFQFVATHRMADTFLLVNEISDHLPIYLWGKGVRRLFALVAEGWRLGATVHAAGAEDVFAFLQRFPLEVPQDHLLAVDLVVTLGMGVTSQGPLRRVVRVESIRRDADEPVPRLLAVRETLRSPLAVYPSAFLDAAAERFSLPVDVASRELAWRQRRIARWVAAGVTGRAAFKRVLQDLRRGNSTEAVDGLSRESTIEETPVDCQPREREREIEESG
ncbi:MAG: type II secretion system protein E [Thermomicrobium sp.]|nr:type II secretion system protein E [Thermomicrobium sp.]